MTRRRLIDPRDFFNVKVGYGAGGRTVDIVESGQEEESPVTFAPLDVRGPTSGGDFDGQPQRLTFDHNNSRIMEHTGDDNDDRQAAQIPDVPPSMWATAKDYLERFHDTLQVTARLWELSRSKRNAEALNRWRPPNPFIIEEDGRHKYELRGTEVYRDGQLYDTLYVPEGSTPASAWEAYRETYMEGFTELGWEEEYRKYKSYADALGIAEPRYEPKYRAGASDARFTIPADLTGWRYADRVSVLPAMNVEFYALDSGAADMSVGGGGDPGGGSYSAGSAIIEVGRFLDTDLHKLLSVLRHEMLHWVQYHMKAALDINMFGVPHGEFTDDPQHEAPHRERDIELYPRVSSAVDDFYRWFPQDDTSSEELNKSIHLYLKQNKDDLLNFLRPGSWSKQHNQRMEEKRQKFIQAFTREVQKRFNFTQVVTDLEMRNDPKAQFMKVDALTKALAAAETSLPSFEAELRRIDSGSFPTRRFLWNTPKPAIVVVANMEVWPQRNLSFQVWGDISSDKDYKTGQTYFLTEAKGVPPNAPWSRVWNEDYYSSTSSTEEEAKQKLVVWFARQGVRAQEYIAHAREVLDGLREDMTHLVQMARGSSVEGSAPLDDESFDEMERMAFLRLAGPERVQVLKGKYPEWAEAIDDVAAADPTGGQQKYLDWAVRMMIREGLGPVTEPRSMMGLKRTLSRFHRFLQYLGSKKYGTEDISKDINKYKSIELLSDTLFSLEDHIAAELRIEEATEKYGKPFAYAIREFARADPTGKQAYLDWALDELRLLKVDMTNEEDVKEGIRRVSEAYGQYERLREKADLIKEHAGSEIASINDLSTEDVEGLTEQFGLFLEAGEPDVMFENDEYVAYGPITNKAQLCSVGTNQWCVARWSSGYWDNDEYMGDDSGNPHFIMVESKDKENKWLAFIRNGNIEAFNDDANREVDAGPFSEIWEHIGLSSESPTVTVYYVTSDGSSDVMYMADDIGSVRDYAQEDSYLRSNGYDIYEAQVRRTDWERASRRGDYESVETSGDRRVESGDPETVTKFFVGPYQRRRVDHSDAWDAFDDEDEARAWVEEHAEELLAVGWTIWSAETTEHSMENDGAHPSNWSVGSIDEVEGQEPDEEAASAEHEVYFLANADDGSSGVREWAPTLEELKSTRMAQLGDYKVYAKTVTAEQLAKLRRTWRGYNLARLDDPAMRLIETVPPRMVPRFIVTVDSAGYKVFEDEASAREHFTEVAEETPGANIQLLSASVPAKLVASYPDPAAVFRAAEGARVLDQRMGRTPEQATMPLPYQKESPASSESKRQVERQRQAPRERQLNYQERIQAMEALPPGSVVRSGQHFLRTQYEKDENGRWHSADGREVSPQGIAHGENFEIPAGQTPEPEQIALPLPQTTTNDNQLEEGDNHPDSGSALRTARHMINLAFEKFASCVAQQSEDGARTVVGMVRADVTSNDVEGARELPVHGDVETDAGAISESADERSLIQPDGDDERGWKYDDDPAPESWAPPQEGDWDSTSRHLEDIEFYHGTPHEFEAFESKPGWNTTTLLDAYPEQITRAGFFFTDNPKFAETFTQGTGRVKTVKLRLGYMLDLNYGIPESIVHYFQQHGINDAWKYTPGSGGHKYVWQLFDGDYGVRAAAALKDAGYHSVTFREDDRSTGEYGTTYVVFDKSQIIAAPRNAFVEADAGVKDWLAPAALGLGLREAAVGQVIEVPAGSPIFQNQVPMRFIVREERGDKVKVTPDYSATYGVWIPTVSLASFETDLQGRVPDGTTPDSGNAAVDAVIRGEGQLLGKGDDGVAWKVGNQVVKMSTTVPYQPMNPGHRTPAEAARMMSLSSATAAALQRLGVPGVFVPETVHHGDKVFQVRPFVEIPKQFTPAELEEVQGMLDAMHQAGYAMRDDLQVGRLPDGSLTFFDIGKAAPIESHDPHFGERGSDLSNLKLLYSQHKTPYAPKGSFFEDAWTNLVDAAEAGFLDASDAPNYQSVLDQARVLGKPEVAVVEQALAAEEAARANPYHTTSVHEASAPYRYYVTMRPPGLGAVPRGFSASESWFPGKRRDIPGVGPAWGWVEYAAPLSSDDINSYELTPAPQPGDIDKIKKLTQLQSAIANSFGGPDSALGRLIEKRDFARIPQLIIYLEDMIQEYADSLGADDIVKLQDLLSAIADMGSQEEKHEAEYGQNLHSLDEGIEEAPFSQHEQWSESYNDDQRVHMGRTRRAGPERPAKLKEIWEKKDSGVAAQIDTLAAMDPTAPRYSYLDWMVRQYKATGTDASTLGEMLQRFDASRAKLDVKDINRYNVNSLMQALEAVELGAEEETQQEKTIFQGEVEGRPWTVRHIFNYPTMCRLGEERWCVGYSGAKSHWQKYMEEEPGGILYMMESNYKPGPFLAFIRDGVVKELKDSKNVDVRDGDPVHDLLFKLGLEVDAKSGIDWNYVRGVYRANLKYAVPFGDHLVINYSGTWLKLSDAKDFIADMEHAIDWAETDWHSYAAPSQNLDNYVGDEERLAADLFDHWWFTSNAATKLDYVGSWIEDGASVEQAIAWNELHGNKSPPLFWPSSPEDWAKLGLPTDDIQGKADKSELFDYVYSKIYNEDEDESAEQAGRIGPIPHTGQVAAQRAPWAAIDLDSTILSYESGMAARGEYGEPLEGAVRALRELKSLGWRISIFTARLSELSDEEATEVSEQIADVLRGSGVPFDDVWVGRKPRADYFIDDKAIPFRGDWDEVLLSLTEMGGDSAPVVENGNVVEEDERAAWALIDTQDGQDEFMDGVPSVRHDRSFPRAPEDEELVY